MTAIHSLKDLLTDELKDLYSAETQLVKALPKMAKAASNEELKNGFNAHLEETKTHVERLDRTFEILGAAPKGKTCRAMKGIIEESEEALERKASEILRDANLIGMAQRIEHYEIAAYGTARSFAETLGQDEIAALLQETLDEEKETDQKLTVLAESINEEAHSTTGSEEMEHARTGVRSRG